MDIHIFAKIFSQQVKKIYCQNNDSKNTNGFYLNKKRDCTKSKQSLFYYPIPGMLLKTKKPPGNDGR